MFPSRRKRQLELGHDDGDEQQTGELNERYFEHKNESNQEDVDGEDEDDEIRFVPTERMKKNHQDYGRAQPMRPKRPSPGRNNPEVRAQPMRPKRPSPGRNNPEVRASAKRPKRPSPGHENPEVRAQPMRPKRPTPGHENPEVRDQAERPKRPTPVLENPEVRASAEPPKRPPPGHENPQMRALETHLQKAPDGLYYCLFAGCTKSFNRRYNCRRHLIQHTNYYRFPCNWPRCTQKYRQKQSLNKHTQKVHGAEWLCQWHNCSYHNAADTLVDEHFKKVHAAQLDINQQLAIKPRNYRMLGWAFD